MKLLIVDDQSTVVQGLLHCTNWAAMGFTMGSRQPSPLPITAGAAVRG